MPLPNSKVAAAFIDSYLNVRKQSWGLELPPEQDKIKIPDNVNVRHKLDICIAILNKIQTAQSFQEWLDLLDLLYEKEKDELETQQSRNFIARRITNDPLIADVLHATRSYIISELKLEDQFQHLKSENTKIKVELEKQILWDRDHNASKDTISAKEKQLEAVDTTLLTRDDNDASHISVYEKKLAPLDPASLVSDEKAFKQFMSDIQKDKRLLTVSERLLAHFKRKQLEAPSTNIQTHVDAAKTTTAKPAAVPVAQPVSAPAPVAAPTPIKAAAQEVIPGSPKTEKKQQPLINIDIDLDATPPHDTQRTNGDESSPIAAQKRTPSPAFFQLPQPQQTVTRRNPRRTGATSHQEDADYTPRAKRK